MEAWTKILFQVGTTTQYDLECLMGTLIRIPSYLEGPITLQILAKHSYELPPRRKCQEESLLSLINMKVGLIANQNND